MTEELARLYLTMVDEQPDEVSDWEAEFIESCMKRQSPLTDKQKDIIGNMVNEYGVA